jgi:branched-chain amino acid aminotransferase
MGLNIKIEKTSKPKAKPDQDHLGFGDYFTDHMFIMDYTEGKGWHDPRIVPYAPITLDPSAMVFHYAQESFEGLKAYKTQEDKIYLFRPDKNAARFNITNDRLCIPYIPEEDIVEAIKELVLVDQDWIPTQMGNSLYIRPFVIATDHHLGVRPSQHYLFMIILSPVGNYYPEGVNPVRIYIETKYVRAVKGGVGFAKAGGNYAASIKSQMEAHEKGYTQVLWLDGVERKYIEEVGTMNVFFKIDGEIVTPSLEGSILNGVTRDSCITLLKKWGYRVTERKISIEELAQAFDAGKLEESFGTGTAAVISPIGEINWDGKKMLINNFKTGEVSQRLYDTISAIQMGKASDEFGWRQEIK